MKNETLKYLTSDLISLLQIMYEFSGYIFDQYSVQVSEKLTITSLATEIFLSRYYKGNVLALINKPSIYNDLKQGYYGGLSEVYRGYGENLFYYDVNSLYPFAALSDMPGKYCKYIESYSDEGIDITKDKLFGFFYCKVKTNNNYIGYLPFRINGLLTYPEGSFEGWFFTPQIEYAKEQGYEIKILKGYSFNRVSNVFKDFITTLYKEKEITTGAKRVIIKFLLNSFLGRFGMHIQKQITTLVVDQNEYNTIITRYVVHNEIEITENLKLVTHDDEVNKVVCEQHGVDYIKALTESQGTKKNKEDTKKKY